MKDVGFIDITPQGLKDIIPMAEAKADEALYKGIEKIYQEAKLKAEGTRRLFGLLDPKPLKYDTDNVGFLSIEIYRRWHNTKIDDLKWEHDRFIDMLDKIRYAANNKVTHQGAKVSVNLEIWNAICHMMVDGKFKRVHFR